MASKRLSLVTVFLLLVSLLCVASPEPVPRKEKKSDAEGESSLSLSTAKTARTRPRDEFYKYAGKSALYLVGVGYTYAFPSTSTKEYGGYLLNAELLNYRYRLLGLSLADFEMQIGPFHQDKKPWGGWLSYRPSVKVYAPIAGAAALCFYGGVQLDATELMSKVNRNMDYSDDLPYYKALNAFGGVAMHLPAMRHVPLEIRAEYRYAVRNKTFMPSGVYLTGRMMIGMPFNRTARGE